MEIEELCALIEEHGKAIYNFCLKLTGNPADADDLYQETFLKAMEVRHKMDKNRNPKSLLISIALGIRRNARRKFARNRFSVGAAVIAFALVMSASAVAATKFLNAGQVAEHLGDAVLAEAFAGSDAIELHQSASSGDYHFTLHGIVSGAGLSKFAGSRADVHPERTYAVVSITRQDGKPMPAPSDPEYGEESFFISPLVKGQKPWLVNIATMGGSYGEFVIDGVMYRLIECDGVEMFADKGVYLAISSGSPFYSSDAFAFDESTGETSVRPDYDGAAILFDLPLDQTKADPAKAEAYLEELLNVSSGQATNDEPSASHSSRNEREDGHGATLEQWEAQAEEWKEKVIAEGTVIPASVKEVTVDEDGRIHYEYDGFKVMFHSPDMLFEEGRTGYFDVVHISGSGEGEGEISEYRALRFHRDEAGVITGRMLVLKE